MEANYKIQILSTVIFSFSMIFSSANANERNENVNTIYSSFSVTEVDIKMNMLNEEPSFDLWSGFDGEEGFTPEPHQYIQVANGAQITLSANLEIAGLLLGEDAELVLNGYQLSINEGDIDTQGGVIDAAAENSVIAFRGNLSQSFNAASIKNSEISELVLDNTSQLNVTNNLKISKLLKIDSGDLNLADANVTFACKFNGNSIQTAQIDQIPATSEIFGNIEVEQCFEARRAFRFVGAPVNSIESIHANWQEGASSFDHNPKEGYGTHITGLGNMSQSSDNDMANGFDWNPSGNCSMFIWNKDIQSWGQVSNTNQTNLHAGDAYRIMLLGDRSTNISSSTALPSTTKLRTYGAPVTGTVDFSNKFSETSSNYAFISNPYQAAVDLKLVYEDAVNVEETALIWDPWLGGIPEPGQPGGRGAWISYNMQTGISTNSDSEFDGFLQPYQAVMFKTLNNETVDLKFKETHKNINQLTLQTFSEPQENKTMQVLLYTEASHLANSTSSDAFVVHFTEDGFNGIDHRDAPKMDNIYENLARFHNGNLLVVENRAYPEANETLPLFINQFSCVDYVFKLNVPEFDGLEAKLVDQFTGETHDLITGTNFINFSISASNASQAFNRFMIKFEAVTLNTTNFENENAISMYPNPVDSNYFHINFPSDVRGKVLVEIFDVQGRKVNSKLYDRQGSASLKVENIDLNSGVYFMKVTGDHGLNKSIKFIKS